MKRVNMVTEQNIYNEQGIDIQYLQVEGVRTITVTAKDSVLVDVVLASMIYRTIKLRQGDVLVAETEYVGETNIRHSCVRNEFGADNSTNISPSNTSVDCSWVIPRAKVEYDLYREEDDYVVETWLSNRGGGGEKLEYRLTTFPNDGFLNIRTPNTLSINQKSYSNSSILNALKVIVNELGNKHINMVISKSETSDLITFKVVCYKDSNLYNNGEEYFDVNFSTFGGALASVFKSDDDLDITRIIQAFERVDIVSLDFKMSFNSEVNSLLEIN